MIEETLQRQVGETDEANSQAPIYPPIERLKPPFDPTVLRQILDGEHAAFRNEIRRIISQPDFAYYEGTDVEEQRRQVLKWTRKIADTGLGRVFMSKSVGGEEDLPKFMAGFETLGFHDTSLVIKIGVQFGLFAGSIQRLGTEYHHQKYLADAASGRLLGCFAMTEIGHGSNVQGLETTSVYDQKKSCFVLNSPTYGSRKTYIGNAGRDGTIATVFAQLEIDGQRHGVHAFVVPIRDANGDLLPGVTIQDNGLKMGLNGVDNGQIWFDHVLVPRTELLNRFATVTEEGRYQSDIQSSGSRFFTMIGTLVSGRISIATSANSIAKSALTIAVRYGARRRQFGPPKALQETLLLDYPAHQRRLFPYLAKVFALDFALKHLVHENAAIQGGDSRSLETLAAGLKAFTTWNTTATIQTCRECCGGEGYLSINRFAALKADTDIYTTFEGDNTVLLQLVAKNLLSDLKEKLKQMRTAQLTGFFVDQKLAVLSKRNPFFSHNILYVHLRDTSFHLTMMRLRESASLLSCSAEFRRLTTSKKLDSYTAFTQMQRHLLDLAQAHIDRVILDLFARQIKTVQSSTLREPLKKLCQLFALTQIEANRAWFLEHGAMSGVKSKAVGRTIDNLCKEIRPIAVHLVDAFGIPDACIAAPIGIDQPLRSAI
jgi:acyl-CoA oxidase